MNFPGGRGSKGALIVGGRASELRAPVFLQMWKPRRTRRPVHLQALGVCAH